MFSASVQRRAPWWVLAFLVLAFISAPASAQCTFTASYGTVTIDPAGTVKTFSTCSFAGEYSTANGAVAGQPLRVESSNPTDYITVRSGTYNGPVVAYGQTPLAFANTYTGPLYAHWSANAACAVDTSACRVTTIQLTSCLNSTSWGAATIDPSGSVVTISTCSFGGEFSTISGAVNGQLLRFTSSVATDFITIRSGTHNGPMVASGATPLVFANTYTGTLYAHWSPNIGCGTESVCRTTTVQSVLALVFRNGFE